MFKQETGEEPKREIINAYQSVDMPVMSAVVPGTKFMFREDVSGGILSAKYRECINDTAHNNVAVL